ncbi:RcpC/CpaB family pilus assembly protein, partial [Streptomyces sp. NPDC047123]|uniref:RcpC/CpaB family pilus assembly protein n=1 Tax=Streptomyces sp. NPDC047123 TaxID=3155622 RepID=UPI00340435F0
PDRQRPPGPGAEQARVTAPVRIADAEAVRLLRPGDRIDVIAAGGSPAGGAETRVVAAGARVSQVPEPGDGPVESGALVVLSVPRDTAARLAGAGASARLAVTLR